MGNVIGESFLGALDLDVIDVMHNAWDGSIIERTFNFEGRSGRSESPRLSHMCEREAQERRRQGDKQPFGTIVLAFSFVRTDRSARRPQNHASHHASQRARSAYRELDFKSPRSDASSRDAWVRDTTPPFSLCHERCNFVLIVEAPAAIDP